MMLEDFMLMLMGFIAGFCFTLVFVLVLYSAIWVANEISKSDGVSG